MTKRRHFAPPPRQAAPPAASAGDDPAALFATLDDADKIFFRRLVAVRAFALWEQCPREACRRAGACRGADVECFDERRAELKQAIMDSFAGFIDIAEILPEEFERFWEEKAKAAGITRDGEGE